MSVQIIIYSRNFADKVDKKINKRESQETMFSSYHGRNYLKRNEIHLERLRRADIWKNTKFWTPEGKRKRERPMKTRRRTTEL